MGKSLASCIDMFIISSHLLGSVTEASIELRRRSDHAMLNLAIKLHDKVRGPGTWKFNDLLLSHEDFKAQTLETIQQVIDKLSAAKPDVVRRELKIECINLAKRFAKSLSQKEKSELETLCILQEELINYINLTKYNDIHRNNMQ